MKFFRSWSIGNREISAFTSLKPLSFKEERLAVNYPRLLAALKLKPEFTAYLTQVHGGKTMEIKNLQFENRQKADGLLTGKEKYMLLIFTADCLPVFLYDLRKGFIALLHCGWKSIKKRIVITALNKLKKKGAKAKDLKVILGPRIKECCYEVKPEFVKAFQVAYGKTGIYRRKGKVFFSLSDIVKLQLKKAGLPKKNITDTKICTCCDKKKFFSYRRDGKGTGRMVSGIIRTGKRKEKQ
ncbi:MAG: peptidoglycan editing factor PgeF [Candidatus Firestonebacteria bacterium]|nr:peptidoglycan editing factor PgeF [Candidatus Firestonebacteria bacterium]